MAIKSQIRLAQLTGSLANSTAALDESSLQGVLDEVGASLIRITGTSTWDGATAGTFYQSIVPSAAGKDIGSTTAEWGNLYLGDDKGVYLGPGQEVKLLEAAGGFLLAGDASSVVTSEALLLVSGAGGAKFGDDVATLDFSGTGGCQLTAATEVVLVGSSSAKFGDDVATLDFNGSGALSDTGITSIDLRPGQTTTLAGVGNVALSTVGTMYVSGATGAKFGDDVSTLEFNGTGALLFKGVGNTALSTEGTMFISGTTGARFGDDVGVLNFDGDGNVIDVGAVSYNLSPTTSFAVVAGTTVEVTGSTVDIDGSGNIAINSTAGSLSFGNDNKNGAIAIGTQGVRTITVGATASTALTAEAKVLNLSASAGNLYLSGAAVYFPAPPDMTGDNIRLGTDAEFESFAGNALFSSTTTIIGALNAVASAAGGGVIGKTIFTGSDKTVFQLKGLSSDTGFTQNISLAEGNPANTEVYVNGQLMLSGAGAAGDYAANSGNPATLTFQFSLTADDAITVKTTSQQ